MTKPVNAALEAAREVVERFGFVIMMGPPETWCAQSIEAVSEIISRRSKPQLRKLVKTLEKISDLVETHSSPIAQEIFSLVESVLKEVEGKI